MTFVGTFPEPEPLRRAIERLHLSDESGRVEDLISEATLVPAATRRIAGTARRLVEVMRARAAGAGGLDAFLHEYELSNREGVVLMCLAEAFLRIPDPETADI